jgi:hypothetical protein
MLRTRDITLTETKGKPVRVSIRGSEPLWIVGLKDGQVFFAKTSGGKPRWQLPIGLVREYGSLA